MSSWHPQPGAQYQMLTCPIFEALMHGTRGGGKTDTLLMDFAQHTGKGFGQHWRGVLFRLTYPQLADVVAKSRRWFTQIFPQAKFNKADYFWEWPDGEMLFFRYGATEDDYWNYHGHEYPWLGFEELTNWKEASFYEAMQSTCRSSFAGMPRRVRATCNPFGKGHGWVKERFQLGQDGAPSGQVIRADGEKPRVAIRSTLVENKALLKNDPDYVATLEALKDPNRRKAWLEGNWDINVGAFFDGVWDAKTQIVAPFAIPASWKVWKAMDWGFAAPYCVLWLAMDPDGCVYVWRELYGQGEKAGEGSREHADVVARKIRRVEEHDERLGYEYRMNLADPAIFSNTGTNNTIGGIFRANGVKWQEAWNGKGSIANGAQEIMRLLAEGKLKIFSTCKNLIRTLPTIGPDDIDPEKYDSDGEDHCFAPDTLVLTDRGPVRIDSLTDELVVNDLGDYVPFERVRVTRRDVDVVRVTFADGSFVVCTPDHKFLTGTNQWTKAEDLCDTICYGVNIAEGLKCESQLLESVPKSSTARGITCAASITKEMACACTELFGSGLMGRSPAGTMCTTKTKTGLTTKLKISSVCRDLSIFPSTQKVSRIGDGYRLESMPQNLGTPALRALLGIASTTKKWLASCTKRGRTSAISAARHLRLFRLLGFAAMPAGLPGGAQAELTTLRGTAPFAELSFPLTNMRARQHALANAAGPCEKKRVISVKPAGRSDVCCITVPERHNFALTNGVIVRNCIDTLRYGVMRRRRSPDDEQQTNPLPAAHIRPDGQHELRA